MVVPQSISLGVSPSTTTCDGRRSGRVAWACFMAWGTKSRRCRPQSPARTENRLVPRRLLHFGHAGFFPVARQHANFHVRIVVQQIDQSQRAGMVTNRSDSVSRSCISRTYAVRKRAMWSSSSGKPATAHTSWKIKWSRRPEVSTLSVGKGAKNLRPRRGHGLQPQTMRPQKGAIDIKKNQHV